MKRLMRLLMRLLAVVPALALLAPAFATGAGDVAALGDPAEASAAVPRLRALADNGDAKAANALGVLYQRGYGVPQDDAEAARWYRKSAEGRFHWASTTSASCTATGAACRRIRRRPCTGSARRQTRETLRRRTTSA